MAINRGAAFRCSCAPKRSSKLLRHRGSAPKRSSKLLRHAVLFNPKNMLKKTFIHDTRAAMCANSKDEKNVMGLRLEDFKQEGLYLFFPDSGRLTLTRGNIRKITKEFWENPEKISQIAKTAIEFQRCPFCPLKEQKDLCDALRPTLPLLEVLDKYVSHDKVTVIYKGDDNNLYHIADTTMQEALKYISIISLMQYCQIGRKYWKYYLGVIPIMGGKEMAKRIYLNIFWLKKGDVHATKNIISAFHDHITVTSLNQVKRMNLICKNDAFINAFVNTHIATEFLTMDIEKILDKAFREFENKTPI